MRASDPALAPHGLTPAALTSSSFGRRSRGFSFTELLFAVMILGIGFILVAAIFPVGLAQTKSNFDETHAASLARSAAAVIERQATAANMSSGTVVPLQAVNSNLDINTQLAQYNMVSPSDPRYAWVALYRRISSNTAHLMIVVTNRSAPYETTGANSDFNIQNQVRALEPRQVRIDVEADGDIVVGNVTTLAGDHKLNADAASPGTFVVLSNANLRSGTGGGEVTVTDSGGGNDTPDSEDYNAINAAMAGRAYRLGALVENTTYSPFPGYEVGGTVIRYTTSKGLRTATIRQLGDARGYIVGRNRITNVNPTTFDGATMDVAYYTTLISLK